MPQNQRDVKNRIASVKNIQKITRAMEMVAAARLRRAEQRISAMRPYADGIRRMTRQAAEAAGSSDVARLPLLREHDAERSVGLLLVSSDRGLAGAFNSQILRAGTRSAADYAAAGKHVAWYASGRRGVSSLMFRGFHVQGAYTGFTERPSYADARTIADDITTAYVDGHVDRVELVYNGYVSPLTQRVAVETLLPIAQADILEADGSHDEEDPEQGRVNFDYEPDPEGILRELVPDYVNVSIYRALLESAASELGARMTAMRSASDNAGEIITDLTLEMNRARQAEITQEILEVVAGAEGVS